MYKFAPAADEESIVFGAARPKYTQESIEQWIEFMRKKEIKKVCCLLEQNRLNRYPIDLLKTYSQNFTQECVLWQPVKDFQIPSSKILIERIIPFLISADKQNQKIVVHCSGGVGRTGIVLACWLISQREFSNQEAISSVKQNKRNPHEALIAALFRCQNPAQVKQQLDYLFNDCRHAFEQY
ncbi:protein-tyrosine phosphatase family protein [Pleurocapsa sp. FMAR1]|uniref:protein-tyrosine phosphatase family protein n=1 Tax=Pleurocapsa sp. FMAR1 TaxID=3040204 RepID=UPI0029C94A51|nr:dual specificity protein phosphatase family protein [Pleurocapsa sp. FMAR1]